MNGQYDFGNGPSRATLKGNKEKITIRLDADVVQWFRDQVRNGGNYQSLINDALKAHIKQGGQSLEMTLRRVIREEMQPGKKQVTA
ncbi:BrnA antitoxin family protein [Candidatus Thiothrix sp. Deng01]|uniref:BrnA antitoxin family protein n=1 Tax=Candidatus Thiothrix phosphatis TaxID=3112415 RepID=A0ABU6CSL6_9GAMM|nr:BrnA antitoxin family protein [Candidatus Thiothrix sp. Deng01]MEB4589809.1 BrnA antitoxin family protein [Candidatus Thiothrix sp. Deng01]